MRCTVTRYDEPSDAADNCGVCHESIGNREHPVAGTRSWTPFVAVVIWGPPPAVREAGTDLLCHDCASWMVHAGAALEEAGFGDPS